LCVQYYKAWVTLYNPAKDAAQGKVRVSVTILEPGDELPPRPGRECPEEAGQPQNFDLHFRCFCAEGLPQMDRTGLADPYVSLIWRDKKTRTPELSNTLTPEFFQELTLPVQIEGNPEAPPSVDLVIVRLREYNRTGNVDIAYGSLYLSDIKQSSWAKPCWLNLYGAPRAYSDRALSAPTGKSNVLEKMNCGKVPGNTYRGRVLLAATLTSPAPASQAEAGTREQDGYITELDKALLDAKKNRAGTSVVRWRYKQPAIPTGRYTLRVGFLVGCDLPVGPEAFIRVCWGVPKEGASRNIVATGVGMDQRTGRNPRGTGKAGLAIWNELLTLESEWPLDPWQVPDVFIELVDYKQKIRTHFLRIELNDIDDVQHMVTGSADMPMLNARWYTLARSTTEELDPALYQPRILMSMGIECDQEIQRETREPAESKKTAAAHQWQNRRHIKVPHVRQDHAKMNSSDEDRGTYLRGQVATLQNLSINALRRRATTAGASEGDLVRARDSDNERQTLTDVLLEHLVRNGGHRQDADHGRFNMRVHVYQARRLQLDDQSGPMPVVVAQTWGAVSNRPPTDTATASAPEGSIQSPCWYETLSFDELEYPGDKAGARELRMAYPLLLSVTQQRRSAPTNLGRLRVPITDLRAKFEKPKWLELRSPSGEPAGELLVGFELYGEDQQHQMSRTLPVLRPSMTAVNLTVVVVGGRELKDTNPSLGEMFGSTTVRSSQVELRPGDKEKRTTEMADGSNPTYLNVETWENLDLPEDELYAPSLSAQVFHETGVMNSRALLGTAELNLAKHVQKFLRSKSQPASSRSISGAEPESELTLVRNQSTEFNSRKGHAYTQLESSDESEYSEDSDESDSELESIDDERETGEDSSGGAGAVVVAGASMDDGPQPFFARRQGKGWQRFISHQVAAEHLKLKASQVAKCLDKKASVKGFDFKYAVEAEGTKELDPVWRIGRRRALDELENCYPELLDTYDDLDIRGADSRGTTASAGTLKVWIGLSEPTAPVPHPQATVIATKIEVTVRAYIVRAFRLTAKDAGNSSDPYVKATIDGVTGSWPKGHPNAGKEVEKTVIPKTLNPYFGQVYEWKNISMPGTPALKVEVFDDDMLGDDPMGLTEIDVEERFFSEEWRKLGVGEDSVVRRPSECRDLFLGESKITQGSIEMWIEIFPMSEQSWHPYVDISPPEKELFELRVVIWDAKDMVPMDVVGDMNDLFVSGHLYYRDGQNRLQETVHETDIHWRAQGGKGSFNYRLLFKDLMLPMDDGSGDSDLPRFVLRAWDQDVLGGNDLIGSAEIDIRDLFRTGWKRLEEQRGRDEAIEKMGGKELTREVSEMWDAQFEQAKNAEPKQSKKMDKIQKNRKKLGSMDTTKLRKVLLESDPKRMLSYTTVRLPDPHKPREKDAGSAAAEDAAKAAAAVADVGKEVAGAVGSVAKEAGQGMCVVLSARPSRECCIRYLQCQCVPGLCRALCRALKCVWRVTCGCRKRVTDKLVETIKTDTVAAHKPLVLNVIGPNALSDSSDDGSGGSGSDNDEEKAADGPNWGFCGQLRIQMELLPKVLADERPVGKGREEPNQFPALPEPEGRMQLSLNPLAMLASLVGPAFATKLLFCILLVGCCVLVAMMVPLILSNVIAHATESAIGLD
jgi:hypothetical protein